MKKIIFIWIVGFGCAFNAGACDVCGVCMGSLYAGTYADYRQDFVGLSYAHTLYRGVPPYSSSDDMLHRVDFTTRVYLTKRLKVLLTLPYKMNNRVQMGENTGIRGLGDMTFLMGYTLLESQSASQRFNYFVEFNGGFQLPTGRYQSDIHDNNLPENFNTGIGAWGVNIQPTMVLSLGQIGLTASWQVQFIAPSRDSYHYGNRSIWNTVLSYQESLSSTIILIPSIGFSGERIAKDRYANNVLVHGTGGQAVFLDMAFGGRWQSFSISGQYSLPIDAHIAGGETEVRNRFSLQLFYHF